MDSLKSGNKRINFLVAGAQKCGTTALHYYLSQHPDIYIHPSKELHFFDDETYWTRIKGEDDFKYFHKNFDGASPKKWVGEATPIYIFWESCAERIHFYNPDMRLIVLLRDPAARAYSQWIMETRRGNETRSFSEVIKTELKELEEKTYKQSRINSYVSRGFYANQLKRFLSFFPKSKVLTLQTESLKQSHQETLKKVWDFLNIKNIPRIRPEQIFSNKYTRIPPFEREILVKNYTKDILEIQEICQFDCSSWLQSSN